MKPSEHLTKARELISDSNHWTQVFYARNSEDKHVDATHPTAVCWCVLGALRKVGNKNTDCWEARVYLERACPLPVNVSVYNDTRNHQKIINLFDNAIELAKQDETGTVDI